MEIQGLWIFSFMAHIGFLAIYKQIHILCISQPECPIHLSVTAFPPQSVPHHILFRLWLRWADPHATLEQVRGSIFQSHEFPSFQRSGKTGTENSIISCVTSQPNWLYPSLSSDNFFSNCIGNSTCHIFIMLLDNAQHSVGSDVTDTCTKQWEIPFVPSAKAIW